jgi:hypothetical protein
MYAIYALIVDKQFHFFTNYAVSKTRSRESAEFTGDKENGITVSESL